MRKSLTRKAVFIASSVLAVAACGSPASAALTTHAKPNTNSTVTYAFYSTATGDPAPSTNPGPSGWMFNDNTDFEVDNPIACESAYLGNITEYLCTVPRAQAPDDTSYDVTFTDDGDMLYSNDPNHNILDPFAGGSPNGRLLPSRPPVTD